MLHSAPFLIDRIIDKSGISLLPGCVMTAKFEIDAISSSMYSIKKISSISASCRLRYS